MWTDLESTTVGMKLMRNSGILTLCGRHLGCHFEAILNRTIWSDLKFTEFGRDRLAASQPCGLDEFVLTDLLELDALDSGPA